MKLKAIGLVVSGLLSVGFSTGSYANLKDDIIQRGTLKCGISSDKMGFSYINDQGKWSGMDVDYCRAVAAAVLGDAEKVEYITTTSKNRFTSLASGEIDILSLYNLDGISRCQTWCRLHYYLVLRRPRLHDS